MSTEELVVVAITDTIICVRADGFFRKILLMCVTQTYQGSHRDDIEKAESSRKCQIRIRKV